MNLRGCMDKSPVLLRSKSGMWPECYIDTPAKQISILGEKYKTLESGRIPLPGNAQDFWAQHKFSVMARNTGAYKKIGKWVASKSGSKELPEVAAEISALLRNAPEQRLMENALLHMWGYVSKYSSISGRELDSLSMKKLLNKIQKLSLSNNIKYLTESTSLSELGAWKIQVCTTRRSFGRKLRCASFVHHGIGESCAGTEKNSSSY